MTETSTPVVAGHAVGTCPQCGAGVGGATQGPATCPLCGARVFIRRVSGMASDSICDEACWWARGPDCECACAGAGHGLGYLHGPVPDRIVVRNATTHRAKRARVEAKATAELTRRQAWLSDDRLGLLSYLAGDADRSEFSADMVRAWERHGELTPRQEAASWVGLKRNLEWAARDAAKALLPVVPAVVGDGTVITGQVVSTRVDDNSYGGTVYKLLVLHDGGWKAWGTAPKALLADLRLPELVGRRVRFTARTAPPINGTDPTFVIFKHARAASLL